MIFENRKQAGEKLANMLEQFEDDKPVILSLPRGGVPVGFEIAKKLHAPLDVIISRKIGAPQNPEFGIGAVSEDNVVVLDKPVIEKLNISDETLLTILEKEQKEIQRRINEYRNGRPLPDVKNKTVILVDDGLATGVTAEAAIIATQKYQPKLLIFASPVCAPQTAIEISKMVDYILCLSRPVDFFAVGQWYREFPQVSDEEVITLLKKHAKEHLLNRSSIQSSF